MFVGSLGKKLREFQLILYKLNLLNGILLSSLYYLEVVSVHFNVLKFLKMTVKQKNQIQYSGFSWTAGSCVMDVVSFVRALESDELSAFDSDA